MRAKGEESRNTMLRGVNKLAKALGAEPSRMRDQFLARGSDMKHTVEVINVNRTPIVNLWLMMVHHG